MTSEPTRPRHALAARAAPPTALAVGLAALAVGTHTGVLDSLDDRFVAAVAHHRTNGLNLLAQALTSAANEKLGIAAITAVLCWLAIRRQWKPAQVLAVTALLGWGMTMIVKLLAARTRPPQTLWIAQPDGPGSFPSGHTTTATLLAVAAAIAVAEFGRRAAIGVTVVGAVFAVAVGLSRIDLGLHHPTDIIGAYLVVAFAAFMARSVLTVRTRTK